MEDFSNILWLLILAGSAAVSIAAKAKENRRKSISDSMKQPAEPNSKESELAKKGSPLRNREGYELQQHFIPLTDDIRSAIRPAAEQELDEIHGDLVTDSQAPQQETFFGKTDIIQDVDLRKAFVWSEILKPKFDEE